MVLLSQNSFFIIYRIIYQFFFFYRIPKKKNRYPQLIFFGSKEAMEGIIITLLEAAIDLQLTKSLEWKQFVLSLLLPT